MRRAILLIQRHEYSLARSYLDALVTSPRITNTQRSRSYYFRGYSYYSQQMYVSAAQDYARSLEYDAGNKATLAAIAHLSTQGLGIKRDLELAFKLSLKAARAGHQVSQYYVGRAYLEGFGTEADLSKARYWLKTSVGDDYHPALVQLAATYRTGPEPEPIVAESLYQKALSLGSTDALVGLAYMHLNGELTPSGQNKTNLELAADYFRQAAGAGIPAGQAGLGYMYRTGQGLKENSRKAKHWFTRAANSGNSFAQVQLAEMHLKKPSLENTRIALDWFRKAARQGRLSVQNSLAWILATTKYSELRDGKQAAIIAAQVVKKNDSANYLDTLAAAFAENGDFGDAVITQQKAIAALDDPERVTSGKYDKRLIAYQNNRAWRE
ncbi:MAG: sel1 repeat family protein [Pseudomonadales bacterium]|nr:sel1 repeat family protein [Pseudomonadales bacterium]